MGEIAEMMLDGTLCQVCGEFIGFTSCFPRTCAACQGADMDHPAPPVKVKCPTCGKRVKVAGLADHQRDVHQSAQGDARG